MDRIDPKIALAPAVVTGPGPNIAEQLGVKLLDERVGENIPAVLAICPSGAGSDVALLGLIQFAAVGDPSL